MKHTYKTENTCSTEISFELNGNVVSDVSFLNGCPGNLLAVSSLTDGMTVEQIEKKLKGIQCGRRGTSCVDQLSIAVRKAYDETAGA